MSERLVRNGAPWRPWRMRDLPPAPAAPDSGAHAEPSAEDTARELAALHAEARRQGHAEGFAAGRAEGHRAGFAEGRAEGLERGREEARREGEARLREECARALAPIAALLGGVEEALARFDEDIADTLIDLALNVGRQLARDALDSKPEALLPLLRELLHGEPELSGKPVLRLHPQDLALVREHLGAELEAAGWQTQADDTLTRGGCLLATADREIDATWEERWRAISAVPRRRGARRGRAAAGGRSATKNKQARAPGAKKEGRRAGK